MIKYDFNNLLEPYEFQYLVRDILQIRDDCFYESFSEGKDGGIDLRKVEHDDTIIIQIKRSNDYNNLITHLKKYELPKVKKLNPDRYIVVTSANILPHQKQQIFELFTGYIKNLTDILSCIDLNNLLGQEKYNSVEINYPKLWFNSGNSFLKKFDKILNSDLYEASRNEYEEIKKMMEYYVPVSNFSSLISSIELNRFLLITGNPGIGKTSLARAICAYFIENYGYQLIYIKNINSADKLYDKNKKQIFLFDDFWGSSFKENDYNSTEEKIFSDLISKINKTTNKILILTTRDYVLKQGIVKNLDISDFLNINKYVLDLKHYDMELRYMILLSHIYRSDLVNSFKHLQYIIDNYEIIIKHKNFNPRIIEYYINSDFYLEVDQYKYFKYFIENLDYPFSFYEKIYKKQTKEAQLLLYLLLTVNNSITLDNLKELYLNALNCDEIRTGQLQNFNIQSVIEQLEKNFIKTKYIDNHGIIVEFINNSIKDYLLEDYDNFFEFERIIISSITYFNQLQFFKNSGYNPLSLKISLKSQKELNEILLNNFDDLNIIRSDFVETLEFEKMNFEQQTIYKLKRIISFEKIDLSTQNFIKEKISLIISSLEKKDRRYIFKDDLASIIELFQFLTSSEDIDELKLIKLYYENCEYTYELFLINEFKDLFKKEYNKFMRGKKNIIDSKYVELIYKDFPYFYKNKMYNSISELIFLLDTNLNYLYKKDEMIQILVKFYETTLESYYDEIDKLMFQESEYDEKEEQMPKIDKFCPNLLNSADEYIGIYLVKTRGKNQLTKEEIKYLIKQIKNPEHEYLYYFLNDKKSVDLIINYYKEMKIFPNKLTDFCQLLIAYIFYKNNICETEIFSDVVNIGFLTFLQNEKIFAIESLKNPEFGIDITNSNINKILNSDLFVKEEKWIRFINPCIHAYCVAKSISLLEKKEKKEFYDNLIFLISPLSELIFDFYDEIKYYYNCFVELDPDGFSKYFISDLFNHFIDSIDISNEKNIIMSFIKFFALSLEFDTLNSKNINDYNYSIINSEYYELINLFMEFKLFDVLSDEAFLEFRDKFIKYFKLENDEYKIDIYDLKDEEKFYNFLKKYEIDKKILELYNRIKLLANYCSLNYFDNIKKYKELLNNNNAKVR